MWINTVYDSYKIYIQQIQYMVHISFNIWFLSVGYEPYIDWNNSALWIVHIV